MMCKKGEEDENLYLLAGLRPDYLLIFWNKKNAFYGFYSTYQDLPNKIIWRKIKLHDKNDSIEFENNKLTPWLRRWNVLFNLFWKLLVFRHFATIFHYLIFSEEYFWQFSYFFVTIRNYDFRKNHNFIMKLIVIWRISLNKENKRFRSKS